MPIRRQDGQQKRIDSWEGHVEQMIREAQARGEFDNLPGAGKPLDLSDNPYAGEWQSAFRTARNAGAAPLWVELDREIAAEREQLREMGQRSARHLQAQRARLEQDGVREDRRGRGGRGVREGPPGQRWWRRLLYGARGAARRGALPARAPWRSWRRSGSGRAGSTSSGRARSTRRSGTSTPTARATCPGWRSPASHPRWRGRTSTASARPSPSRADGAPSARLRATRPRRRQPHRQPLRQRRTPAPAGPCRSGRASAR